MARLRTWAEWEALEGADALTPAERHLVTCCKAGEGCILGDGTRPDAPSPERTIRADLLRYLILGGCEACRIDNLGVQLVGAFVNGTLDISFGQAQYPTSLRNCHFTSQIVAFQSRLKFLNLIGSKLPGLFAHGASVEHSIVLQHAVVNGEICLLDAHIGEKLECSHTIICDPECRAIDAQGARIRGGIFLNKNPTIHGEINLVGSKIGGCIVCEYSKFFNEIWISFNLQRASILGDVYVRHTEVEGTINLSSANIMGDLECVSAEFSKANGRAFIAQGLDVTGAFCWRGIEVKTGTVSLASAHVRSLVDDLKSWPGKDRLYLNGFVYDQLSGVSPINIPWRLEWLRLGSHAEGAFFPQPYTQFAKVLREMGHDSAARTVLMARERLIRRKAREDARKASKSGPRGFLKRCYVYPATWLGAFLEFVFFRFLTGYGYAPWRSLVALLILFLAATFLADRAWTEGSFAPNSGPVLVSDDWKDFVAPDCTARTGNALCSRNPAEAWSAAGAPGADWDSFNRYGYAADLVVPILDLGQTAAWAPSKDRGAWGKRLWWGRWLLSPLGWIVTALGAAAITGIIRQDRG